jgi:hypothetical protein
MYWTRDDMRFEKIGCWVAKVASMRHLICYAQAATGVIEAFINRAKILTKNVQLSAR